MRILFPEINMAANFQPLFRKEYLIKNHQLSFGISRDDKLWAACSVRGGLQVPKSWLIIISNKHQETRRSPNDQSTRVLGITCVYIAETWMTCGSNIVT
jgi:hypothetical protein